MVESHRYRNGTLVIAEPAVGRRNCRGCNRDLFRNQEQQHGPYCDSCNRILLARPDVDLSTMRNGRSEVLLQERPIEDASWRKDAACVGAPPELFEPLVLLSGHIPAEVWIAAELWCDRCPVLDACRREADEHRYEGLWGGCWRSAQNSQPKSYRVRDLLAVDDTEVA